MRDYIVLTRFIDSANIVVNTKYITYISTHYRDKVKTIISFVGDENNYIEVKESIQEIISLLDRMENISR